MLHKVAMNIEWVKAEIIKLRVETWIKLLEASSHGIFIKQPIYNIV